MLWGRTGLLVPEGLPRGSRECTEAPGAPCLLLALGFVLPHNPYPPVVVRTWQGQPGGQEPLSGCPLAKAGSSMMKHILTGCGAPQPAPGTWGIPNHQGGAPACPHHPLLTWDTSSCACSSKNPMAAPSRGAQWGAGMWGPDPVT